MASTQIPEDLGLEGTSNHAEIETNNNCIGTNVDNSIETTDSQKEKENEKEDVARNYKPDPTVNMSTKELIKCFMIENNTLQEFCCILDQRITNLEKTEHKKKCADLTKRKFSLDKDGNFVDAGKIRTWNSGKAGIDVGIRTFLFFAFLQISNYYFTMPPLFVIPQIIACYLLVDIIEMNTETNKFFIWHPFLATIRKTLLYMLLYCFISFIPIAMIVQILQQ